MRNKTIRNKYKKKYITKLFYSFYAINEIWFKTVGKSEYGYPLDKILPHSKEKIINQKFEEYVNLFSDILEEALEYSVRREILHFKTFGVGTRDDWGFDIKTKEFYQTCRKRYGLVKTWDLSMIYNAFNLPWADDSYGGRLWAVATAWLIRLKKCVKLIDKVFIIDRILDLQHNNGFILNKTNFVVLNPDDYGRDCHLDIRAQATLDKLVSNSFLSIQKIYNANKNWI